MTDKDGVWGNDDVGWFVKFGKWQHGPFDSYQEANDAYNEMLRDTYDPERDGDWQSLV